MRDLVRLAVLSAQVKTGRMATQPRHRPFQPRPPLCQAIPWAVARNGRARHLALVALSTGFRLPRETWRASRSDPRRSYFLRFPPVDHTPRIIRFDRSSRLCVPWDLTHTICLSARYVETPPVVAGYGARHSPRRSISFSDRPAGSRTREQTTGGPGVWWSRGRWHVRPSRSFFSRTPAATRLVDTGRHGVDTAARREGPWQGAALRLRHTVCGRRRAVALSAHAWP